ncbi:MAG TPA: alpha/beta hydrolase [Amycolatopsis sp.]|nr:alpha/beta hydrolase [Amycolatopsis sp.]
MHTRRGGEGEATVLLLHGLGATGEVWRGLTDRLDAAWIAPDLPGHGRSETLGRYSFGRVAAELAELVPEDRPVVVLGHSFGGVLALTLASGWFRAPVAAVCGLGIKVRWSDDDLARARDQAKRPPRRFATREEAAERWLKVSGLHGLWPVRDVGAGVAETPEGWRVALDQAAFGVGAPDMPGLLAACRAPVTLAAGEHDPMCPAEHLRDLVAEPVVLPGLGHNAHVEDPDAVVRLLQLGANSPQIGEDGVGQGGAQVGGA